MIHVSDKKMCCGCGACEDICPKKCISMEFDREGFRYPTVSESQCVGCNACDNVCPMINQEERKTNPQQLAAIVQNKNDCICKQSTAGGAFTQIAEYVIKQGGCVFGVEMTSEYVVHHVMVEQLGDLERLRNSKYVQSNTSGIYALVKEQLIHGRMVCFSGTPCQIEGLRHYLKKDYDNLILVDVVCRAVPSPGVWKKYMEMETQKHGKITSVRFRDKTLGYQYSTMVLKTESGATFRGGIESQPWLRMFFSGMIIRPSCTNCPFRNQYRNSDFTIWDCFHVRDLDDSFDEIKGATRILIHTTKGKDIFNAIENGMKIKMISVETAVADVKEMRTSPSEHEKKADFYQDMEQFSMEEVLNKYFPMTLKVKLKKNARLFLNRFGLDRIVKRVLRKVKSKERR